MTFLAQDLLAARSMRWLLPGLGIAILAWAVVLAFQGRFGVAFAISIFSGCCFQLDRMLRRPVD